MIYLSFSIFSLWVYLTPGAGDKSSVLSVTGYPGPIFTHQSEAPLNYVVMDRAQGHNVAVGFLADVLIGQVVQLQGRPVVAAAFRLAGIVVLYQDAPPKAPPVLRAQVYVSIPVAPEEML
jgi:hypothetical protein